MPHLVCSVPRIKPYNGFIPILPQAAIFLRLMQTEKPPHPCENFQTNSNFTNKETCTKSVQVFWYVQTTPRAQFAGRTASTIAPGTDSLFAAGLYCLSPNRFVQQTQDKSAAFVGGMTKPSVDLHKARVIPGAVRETKRRTKRHGFALLPR